LKVSRRNLVGTQWVFGRYLEDVRRASGRLSQNTGKYLELIW